MGTGTRKGPPTGEMQLEGTTPPRSRDSCLRKWPRMPRTRRDVAQSATSEVMSVEISQNPVLQRLLSTYGTLLTLEELASELRTSKSSIYNRRSRGNAAGLPDPVPGTVPYLWRTAEIAQWLLGEITPAPPASSLRSKRKVGRPRKGVSHVG